jgi:hypothetical protein
VVLVTVRAYVDTCAHVAARELQHSRRSERIDQTRQHRVDAATVDYDLQGEQPHERRQRPGATRRPHRRHGLVARQGTVRVVAEKRIDLVDRESRVCQRRAETGGRRGIDHVPSLSDAQEAQTRRTGPAPPSDDATQAATFSSTSVSFGSSPIAIGRRLETYTAAMMTTTATPAIV